MTTGFDRMWDQLAVIGRDDTTGGYHRFAWTRTDHDLREWFASECAARGLELTEDRAGNQWAWWGDPDVLPGIVIGSHLDSVPAGGAFDGPLGVVSALATVDALRVREAATGVAPARPIGVVNFVDEEGARFGIACAGSRIITGALTADRARGLTDADGVTMAEAWRAAGRDPDTMGPDPQALGRVAAFVELHVEQGRALALAPDGTEDLSDPGRAVAIGTEIWPHGRWRLEIPGEANHAGTTRLEDRHDAMLGLASVVQQTRSYAAALGCVATVGKVLVEPGGVNAVPSHVTAWLDARGADEHAVHATVDGVIGVVRELGGSHEEESWTAPTRFDGSLVRRLTGILPDAPLLGTGAGHDAGILATHGIPSAMLFVRNPTGISHSPAEFAEPGDCHRGVAALTAVVTDLCTSDHRDPGTQTEDLHA
ncbi:allantoate amidohydrolase [Intrasporangium sp.]|uniref:allantoate amidohydrolase n=1 Tax=Intrasporangium sp. TaxID=1925024 RepID=UPI00293A44F0|nr:allantoate amidohydrolase [Intrasporangium sp.]MDV3222787.1 allantoate amidohydrolase [Intrasporangium sp.]